MKSKSILVLTGVMLLYATGALASGINVFIDDSGLKDKDGQTLPAGDYHPYKNKLEFFLNSLPAPTSNSGKLTVDTNLQYTKPGSMNKYQYSDLNGGTLYVRIWTNAVAPQSAGNNYYGKTQSPIAAGAATPIPFTITDLKAVYKADRPNMPTVGGVSESIQRNGDSQALQLVIPISYSEAGPDGNREAQSFSLAITYPDGKTETKAGSSVTLSNVPTGTYKFKPTATNWYGSTTGQEASYTTLGGGGAAPAFTYYFYPPAGTSNVVPTTVTLVNLALTRPTATTVAKASDLASVINGANTKKIVASICKGEPASGALKTAIFDANGNIIDATTDFPLVAGEPVQIYATATGEVTIQ